MLEQKDLEMIRKLMKEELHESENLLLKEMDRMQINFEKKINEVQKNLDELRQYYRITNLKMKILQYS